MVVYPQLFSICQRPTMTRNCSRNFLHKARAAASKSKSSMKRSSINNTAVNTECIRTKVRSGFGKWIKAALLVAAVCLTMPKSFGFVEVLRPSLYMAERVQAPTQSPFWPYVEPQPLLDFQPWAPPRKPEIRTPQEIANWGYIIWQQWAYLDKLAECYDPLTEQYIGWTENYWEWDVNLGYRLQIWKELNGAPYYLDTGWMWSGSAQWNRQAEGNTFQIRPWYYTDGNGYKCWGEEKSDSAWKLRNFGAQSGPQFEVAVAWDIRNWPYGWHIYDAYNAGTVREYSTWRIIACDRGASIDITPSLLEVPRNYRMTAYPYLISAYRHLAYNNADLPEWVEGWE